MSNAYGPHPFTCKSCHLHLSRLKHLIGKRKKAVYSVGSRLGYNGFRNDFARKDEVTGSQKSQKREISSLQRQMKGLEDVIRSKKAATFNSALSEACKNDDQKRIVLVLLKLFREDMPNNQAVQYEVLCNFVTSLKSKNNTKYTDIIKDISGLFRNRLGKRNYTLMKTIFRLPCNTTAGTYAKKTCRIIPGFNDNVIQEAIKEYKGKPVVACSDEARTLRFIEPYLNSDKQVEMVGMCYKPDIDDWRSQRCYIPRRDASKGQLDDFTALKELITSLVKRNRLSKSTSIHKFSSLADFGRAKLVHAVWPVPNPGYKSVHLLKIWQHLVRRAFHDQSDNRKLENPLHLLGVSTDSAGFSLAAMCSLMTPTVEQVKSGVKFLTLGVPGEKYAAPYVCRLPLIGYIDWDHAQRTFLRCLLYDTLDLVFYEKNSLVISASKYHLQELRSVCLQKGVEAEILDSDLVLVRYFDQNPDASRRVFNRNIVDLLQTYVPGSSGTQLYITSINCPIEPFANLNFGSPEDIQLSLSTGITILRLWRSCINITSGKRLHAAKGAKEIKQKKGNFITYGAYTDAELLFSAGSLHMLAMFLHFKELGPEWSSPHKASTMSTERIISELQGKTTQIQSLDSQPTFKDILCKIASVQFSEEAEERLALKKLSIPATSHRKRKLYDFQTHKSTLQQKYTYPKTYEEFRARQQRKHEEGVNAAKELVKKYLPEQFISTLKKCGMWNVNEECSEWPHDMEVIEEGMLPNDYCKCFQNVLVNEEVMSTIEKNLCQDEFTDKWDDEHADLKRPSDQLVTDVVDETTAHNKNTVSLDGVYKDNTEKWYISRVVNGQMTKVHINRALKLILPHEYISRDRSRGHWATKYLPSFEQINKNHDIVQFRDAIVDVTSGREVVTIIAIKDSGKEVRSASSNGKEVEFQGRLYKTENNQLTICNPVKITRWLKGKAFIKEVVLKKMGSGNYGFDTTMYDADEKDLDKSELHHPEEECADVLEDGFYEVDRIVDVRAHPEFGYEYKVRFTGYTEADDQWLPATEFNQEIHFTTISSRGRKVKRVVKDQECAVNPTKKNRTGTDRKLISAKKEGNLKQNLAIDDCPKKKLNNSVILTPCSIATIQDAGVPKQSFVSEKLKKDAKTEDKEKAEHTLECSKGTSANNVSAGTSHDNSIGKLTPEMEREVRFTLHPMARYFATRHPSNAR